MAKFLVLFGTVEGHTRRIAEYVAERLAAAGNQPVVVDAANVIPLLLEEGEYDAAVICAPVHLGEHPLPVVDFVRENLRWLESMPTALISVSLVAALPDPQYQLEARSYTDRLRRETGWHPSEVLLAGGALRYSHYDYFKGFLVRLIAERKGAATDRSRDWEYTDWEALNRFVDRLIQRVIPPRPIVSA
jgi:menaquinone-dependent protoporphyrinogen oxidase